MQSSTLKSVQVSKETRDRIRKKTKRGETVNLVLSRLLDKYEGLL